MAAQESGGGCRPRELLLVLVLAAAAWGIYLSRTDFHIVPREDVMEQVVAARQFAAGDGYTTRVASPSMLTFLAEQDRLERPWPNALRSPLPVMLIGWLIEVFSEPTAVALSSGIFFVLSVPLIYLLACRVARRTAGILAAAAYAFSPAGVYLASTGLTESSTIFALAAIFLLLMRPISWKSALAAGVVAGIAWLGRSTVQMWAVLMVVWIIWASWEDGWGRAILRSAAFCVPLGIAIWWWGAQMGALTGEFGYSAQPDIMIRLDTDLYPERSSALTLEHWGTLEFINAHPGEIVKKYGRIAAETWPLFITMGGMPLLVGFFVAEMVLVLAAAKRGGVRWLAYLLLAQMLLIIPLASFGHGGVGVNRYLDPLGPICATFGAAFIVELLRRQSASMRLTALPLGLVVLITAVPTFFDMAVGPYHQGALDETRELVAAFEPDFDTDDVTASTHASLVGWATGVYAVRLPMTPEAFLRMDREMVTVDWVHISRRGEGNEGQTTAWEPIMAGEEALPGFEMHARLDDGGVILRRAGSE